ncbi:hypothetical protein VNO77_26667 [Canavalia gladiata]|uniref:Uncharacterized protein n=1 Tax=Canavalia gladiata TaxID=3824 RepID=A0AAN9KVS0_CANGL
MHGLVQNLLSWACKMLQWSIEQGQFSVPFDRFQANLCPIQPRSNIVELNTMFPTNSSRFYGGGPTVNYAPIKPANVPKFLSRNYGLHYKHGTRFAIKTSLQPGLKFLQDPSYPHTDQASTLDTQIVLVTQDPF